MLAEELFQDDLSFLDPRRIELAFNRQADFALLEAVQDVRLRNGMGAVVTDAANDGPLFDFEDDDLAVGLVRAVLDAQLHVLEELGIPQRLKIAAQRFFVEDVCFAAENTGLQCVAAHAAIADELDSGDDKLCIGALPRGRLCGRSLRRTVRLLRRG